MDDSAGADIVERAIAILDEEVRSWTQPGAVRGPSEPVSPPDEGDQGGEGG
jgi:hypothetical protein